MNDRRQAQVTVGETRVAMMVGRDREETGRSQEQPGGDPERSQDDGPQRIRGRKEPWWSLGCRHQVGDGPRWSYGNGALGADGEQMGPSDTDGPGGLG